jgi:NDP-sugar pyrophosphorylase family protein
MQAIILAAGEGKRLRPLTLDKPKPLVEVNGKPLLEHNLDNLVGFIEEVILIIGYKGEKIKEKYGDSYKGMKLKYVEQKEQLGTGHALLQAEDLVKGKFLVLNADDLFSKKDVENCLKHELCIVVKKVKNPERFGIVFLENNKLKSIIEKPKEFIGNLANTGFYVLHKDIFEEIKKVGKSERGEYELVGAITSLAQKKEIKCTEAEYYIPIGYPEDLAKASRILSR